MKIWVKRAVRTFIQTAVSYIAVNVVTVDFSVKSAVVGFVVSTAAAGMAAVMNLKENS